jgi:hypothetical protein
VSDNLALWDKVKTTDPEYTKQVNQRGGYTSVSPQYQIMQATEQFGSYGKGWGFKTIKLSLDHLDATGLVMVEAVFFYVTGDKEHTFPINNSWPVKMGERIDSDFAKKAETNTMGKALSKLGFSADIFMGEFDNPDYVAAISDEFALEKADNKVDEMARQEEEHQEWVRKVIESLSTCQSENELKGVFSGAVRKARLRKDDVAIARFTRAKDSRKTELEAE